MCQGFRCGHGGGSAAGVKSCFSAPYVQVQARVRKGLTESCFPLFTADWFDLCPAYDAFISSADRAAHSAHSAPRHPHGHT
jgi:hypothetical protein